MHSAVLAPASGAESCPTQHDDSNTALPRICGCHRWCSIASTQSKILQALVQLVCFDVDSTFCTNESIDELAAFVGKGDEVAEMTQRAMGGSVRFQDALKMRLDTMNVSKRQVQRFQREHPAQLSPGAAFHIARDAVVVLAQPKCRPPSLRMRAHLQSPSCAQSTGSVHSLARATAVACGAKMPSCARTQNNATTP